MADDKTNPKPEKDDDNAFNAEDVAVKSKIARVAKKHRGDHRPKSKIPGSKGTPFKRKINGPTVRRDET